jgi:hypothetical protein
MSSTVRNLTPSREVHKGDRESSGLSVPKTWPFALVRPPFPRQSLPQAGNDDRFIRQVAEGRECWGTRLTALPLTLQRGEDCVIDCSEDDRSFMDLIPSPASDPAFWEDWCLNNGHCFMEWLFPHLIDHHDPFDALPCSTVAQAMWDRWSTCPSPPVCNPDARFEILPSVAYPEPRGWNIGRHKISDYISLAVKNLQLNSDILQWASCLLNLDVYGIDVNRCIESYLDGGDVKMVRVRFLDSWNDGKAITKEVTDDCLVSINSKYWEDKLFGPDVPRKCFMMELCSTMAHELLHCCENEMHNMDNRITFANGRLESAEEPGGCSFSYAFGGIVNWALWQRFACRDDWDVLGRNEFDEDGCSENGDFSGFFRS